MKFAKNFWRFFSEIHEIYIKKVLKETQGDLYFKKDLKNLIIFFLFFINDNIIDNPPYDFI